jgi:hypothetical protein
MRRLPRFVVMAGVPAMLLQGCDSSQSVDPAVTAEHIAAGKGSTGAEVAAPSNALATPFSQTMLDVSWQDNSSNESRFEIHRSSTGDSGTFSLLVNLEPNTAAFRDQGLAAATQYCYRVRSVRVTGNKTVSSLFSNTTCASTDSTVTPPPPPQLVAPSNASARAVSESGIEITWQDNLTGETSYWIFRSDPSDTTAITLLRTIDANAVFFADQGLYSGTRYCYLLRAQSFQTYPATLSEPSNIACATTAGSPPAVPAAATGTVAVPWPENQIHVTWTDNATNELGYRVHSSIDGGATWSLRGSTIGTSFLEAVTSEQTVCYRVVAFNSGGEALPSNVACTAVPAAPSFVSATPAGDTIELKWTDNSAMEDGYEIYLEMWNCYPDPFSAGMWESIERLAVLPANSTSYTFVMPAKIECVAFGGVFVVATKDGGQSEAAWLY